MSTETTNKKIKIDNGTTFGKTYTDKAIDAKLPTDLIASANKLSLGVGTNLLGNGINLSGFTYDEATKTLKTATASGIKTNVITITEDGHHFTGNIDLDALNFISDGKGQKVLATVLVHEGGKVLLAVMPEEDTENGGYKKTATYWMAIQMGTASREFDILKANPQYWSHFITLTKGSDTIYLQYQNASWDELTMDDLKTALTNKTVLATGIIGNSDETIAMPTFVHGEAGNLEVSYILRSSNTIASKSIIDYTITDVVNSIEQ